MLTRVWSLEWSMRVRKVLVILFLVCVVLSGCQKAGQNEVSFMVFGDPAELAAYQKLVATFEARFPAIQVELRHVASQGVSQKELWTTVSAGAEPDVMLLNYRRFLQFAARGGLEPVGPYLDKSQVLHTADFYPQALEAFQWDGKTWCVPQNGAALVDALVKPPRLTLDDPAALDAFQWFVDLQVREHVVPDAAAEQVEPGENRFMNGRLAMFFNSRRGGTTYR